MTDPVAPPASSSAPQPVPRAAPPAAPPPPGSGSRAQSPQVRAAQPPPIQVDVGRRGDVFIYTLRDPATDTVLTVIPREEVAPDRDGRNVDRRV